MPRTIGGFVIAASLLLSACERTPPPTPTLRPDAATLTISGSGELCGPWWFGCGAVLVIKPAGWKFEEDWVREAGDTVFAVDLRAATEETALITGVAQQGRDRIDLGTYTVAGVLTMQSDVGTEPPSATLGCSIEATIPSGTRAVTIDIAFDGSFCRITVSLDGRGS